MIVKKRLEVSPPGKIMKAFNEDAAYVMDFLNELQRENIIQIVTISGAYGTGGYEVFYETRNVRTCPGCQRNLSNTFSFCPNCGRKLK